MVPALGHRRSRAPAIGGDVVDFERSRSATRRVVTTGRVDMAADQRGWHLLACDGERCAVRPLARGRVGGRRYNRPGIAAAAHEQQHQQYVPRSEEHTSELQSLAYLV